MDLRGGDERGGFGPPVPRIGWRGEVDLFRTSLDIPVDLHRRLHQAAARQGCSVRRLILRSIERAVDDAAPERPKRRLRLDKPIVPSTGKPFDLTNQRIYDLIEFP